MRALLGRLEQADGVVELQRLARQQRELRHEPQVHEDEHDRRELEELPELDIDLEDRQRDRCLEQQVLVRDPRDGDH